MPFGRTSSIKGSQTDHAVSEKTDCIILIINSYAVRSGIQGLTGPRGFDITTALSRTVSEIGKLENVDVIIYDVGPNVGALNRVVLLDCDYFITPVATDLFSLRALNTVGRSLKKWVTGCNTIRGISPENKIRMLKGHPAFIGYITSAYKVRSGGNAASPHTFWENKIAPRISSRIVRELSSVDPSLVATTRGNKLGSVKHFHSLAPQAQELHIPISELRGHVNPGHYQQISEAKNSFLNIAKEIVNRTGI